MASSLSDLERLLGYRFADISLLQRAVTHRSWAYENMADRPEAEIKAVENEVPEFLGDSVLGLAMAEAMYRKSPDVGEGALTLMKHHLVSTAMLAKVAERMDLGIYLRVGRGEEKTGGRQKQALLANLLEAVIGAIFIDSGYVAARSVVNRIFADEIKAATPRSSLDYKSLLQETLQADHKHAPSYRVVKTAGPPHDRTFFVEANWDGGTSAGHGNSIKAAEMMAANLAVEMITGNMLKDAADK